MSEPCKPDLLRHTKLDHEVLRKVLGDGRCPICDLSVSPNEYADVIKRVLHDPDLRKRVYRR